jgi:NitT/TauT family transport system ATP-binding protein
MPNEENDIKIKVRNLTKYFGELHVLDDVSFDVKKGEFLCVVGPTGCGKTTFLNLLTRLIPATSGELYINDVPADPKIHNISFAFQEPSAFPWLTVEQNLEFGMKIKNLPPDVIKTRVERVIKLLGLEKFRKSYPHQLSASSEQRVIIGRAFAMYPDLLLMDEPYGQMDIKMRYYLEDEVIKLWKEFGSTVIFITHNIEEAVYLAERILILSNKPAQIKSEIYVDLPRPRDFADPKFVEIRKLVTDQIKWW